MNNNFFTNYNISTGRREIDLAYRMLDTHPELREMEDTAAMQEQLYELIKDELYYCQHCGKLAASVTKINDEMMCYTCANNYVRLIDGNYGLATDVEYAHDESGTNLGCALRSELRYAQDTQLWYLPSVTLYEHNGMLYFEDVIKADPTIYSYHYHKNAFGYIGVDSNDLANQMGIELEIVADDDGNRLDLTHCITEHTNLFVFERDSSIGDDGVECISHITSYNYLDTHKAEFKKMCSDLIKLGARSHDTDTCGLHIHVNRAVLGDTLEERNNTLTKLLLLVEMFKTEVQVFSRRKSNTYARFRTLGRPVIERAKGIIRDTLEPEHHYYNVNTQPTNTIEFRMFRGTLKWETILASIDFCYALIKCARNNSEERLATMDFDDVLYYACRNTRTYYESRFNGIMSDKEAM